MTKGARRGLLAALGRGLRRSRIAELSATSGKGERAVHEVLATL